MKKLLLVDDSSACRLAMRRAAVSLGFEALEAEDGAKALDVVRDQRDIDVILLDWIMPVMDGLTFLKTIRAETFPRQPVVLMCTSENDMSHVLSAIEAGADEFIMKPFTEEIVRDKLEAAGVL